MSPDASGQPRAKVGVVGLAAAVAVVLAYGVMLSAQAVVAWMFDRKENSHER